MPGEAFDETGIIRIRGAFGARDATRMRDVVWNELRGRYGIRRDDTSTWRAHPPTGLKSSKRSPAFAPICGPAVAATLDAVLGAGRWRPPKHYGNVLVTMPDATEWRVPHRLWHPDFPPTLPADHVSVVKLWALFDDIEPGGGGTPQLAGSHRAFARYLARTGEPDSKRAKLGFLGSDPWLKTLTRDEGASDRDACLLGGADVDGVHLRVVECTGRAGDVFVTHPWVFHSIAVNASVRPRLMRSVAIWASAPP